jgi:hypothetical protein
MTIADVAVVLDELDRAKPPDHLVKSTRITRQQKWMLRAACLPPDDPQVPPGAYGVTSVALHARSA